MSKAYLATGEYSQLICAYDKNASKALKKIAKKINSMQRQDEWLMLTGVNVGYDEEGFYNVTATVSSAVL
jgi:hypothetical protein